MQSPAHEPGWVGLVPGLDFNSRGMATCMGVRFLVSVDGTQPQCDYGNCRCRLKHCAAGHRHATFGALAWTLKPFHPSPPQKKKQRATQPSQPGENAAPLRSKKEDAVAHLVPSRGHCTAFNSTVPPLQVALSVACSDASLGRCLSF